MSEIKGSRTLKSANLAWLIGLTLLDAVLILVCIFPEVVAGTSMTQLAVARLLLGASLSVVVLILANVLPQELKAVLVFWRVKHPLPGARAFSMHAPRDARIDMASLKRHVGSFPTSEDEQNAFWYRLYKRVITEPAVVEAHKSFLLYRDMASCSVLLAVLVPPAAYGLSGSIKAAACVLLIFVVQYLVTAQAARLAGVRLVCNVLAEHSARKVPASSTRAAVAKA